MAFLSCSGFTWSCQHSNSGDWQIIKTSLQLRTPTEPHRRNHTCLPGKQDTTRVFKRLGTILHTKVKTNPLNPNWFMSIMPFYASSSWPVVLVQPWGMLGCAGLHNSDWTAPPCGETTTHADLWKSPNHVKEGLCIFAKKDPTFLTWTLLTLKRNFANFQPALFCQILGRWIVWKLPCRESREPWNHLPGDAKHFRCLQISKVSL